MKGFAKAHFWLDRRLWVIAYMVNDTFNWNTATVCRYGIMLLGIMVYTDRFLNHVVQYIVQDCVTIVSVKYNLATLAVMV